MSMNNNNGGLGSIALQATGMSKTFGEKLAVDDVSLTLRRGEIHALLGENGAGKSTLISMICGQYRPDEGSILVNGDIKEMNNPKDALLAGIGVVHQDFRLVPPFTAFENIILGSGESSNKVNRVRCQEIADRLGFNLDLDARVASLPVGQRQQTEIIKMLFRGLDILILDEPTAVLTPQQAEQLFFALRTLAEEGNAVVFVSHRLHEVAAVADHLTVLRQGRVVADRPADGIDSKSIAKLMLGEIDVSEPILKPAVTGEVVLELAEVHTDGTSRDTLNGISVAVRAGEIVGIAGVSGNGQRDLAEVAAGTKTISSGVRQCTSDSARFIPEDRLETGLVGSMSVAKNLAMRDFNKGAIVNRLWLSPKKMNRDSLGPIEQFKIPVNNPGILVGGLSGGGQQRVIIARELAEQPSLLIASQPSRGLDVASARAVQSRLVHARDNGAAVLVISEDLDELMLIADRIVVLVGGVAVGDIQRSEATIQTIGELMTGALETLTDLESA